MSPAERRADRALRACGIVEAIVPTVSIRLQDPAVTAQMSLGMLSGPVARGVEQRRRRVRAAEGAVVTDIGPDPAGDRLALGQDRHRGVVAVQPPGRQNMRGDQREQGRERGRAGTDLIGQRRDRQRDPLPGEALALAVQRLMLAELLEQDRGQELRPGKAARRDVERCGRLRDRLAGPA